MFAQLFETDGGQHQRAPALLRLQGLQHEVLADPLQLLAHADVPGLEVHVVPAQAGRLAQPEARREGDREEGAEAVPMGDGQKRAGLLHGQRHESECDLSVSRRTAGRPPRHRRGAGVAARMTSQEHARQLSEMRARIADLERALTHQRAVAAHATAIAQASAESAMRAWRMALKASTERRYREPEEQR